MSYVQTVLADRPAGFWMITAPSGTSETDLSGNGKTATITEATDLIDRAYRPLVTGTSSDIAYRMYSTNHKLSYPAMEAWEVNREHIPFSIELTFQPVDCTKESILFAPQAASSAYVMDNGLYCKNNTLFFIISNGSESAPATVKTVVKKYLEPGKTYHVVAIYDTSKIYLYVDNVLVDSADVKPGTRWSHTTVNFITMSNRVTTDTLKSEFIFDGVSFYRQALDTRAINNHYVMSTPTNSDVDIVNSLGGKIIKINDEDRVKSFDWSGADKGWNSDDITLTDCVINDDGSVGLRQIPPVELRSTPGYYGNMLTWNQATVDVDITDWVNQTTGIANMTRTTTAGSVLTGSGSLLFDCTVAGTASAIPDTKFPVEPGETYSGTASFKLIAGSTPGNVSNCKLQWYKEDDTFISEVQGTTFTPNSSWQQSTMTGVAPDTAKSARLQILSRGLGVGNQVAFDSMGLFRGSSTTWIPPVTNRSIESTDYSNERVNLVSRFHANGYGTGTWTSYNGQATITPQSTYLLSGTSAFGVTTTSTIDIQVGAGASTGTGYGFFPVTPGKTYTVTGSCYAPESGKTFSARIRFHSASGSFVNNLTTSTTTVADSWVTATGQITPPAGAAYACIAASVIAPSNGVTYRFDNFGIYEGVVSSFSEPTFNVDEINLSDSRMVVVRNAGRYIGKNSGGFGFFADFSATENDHVGEQALAGLSNTAGDSVIEVVKKSDKNLYLRYKYLNTAGDLTTTEASWGAISSLLATTPYIYVEWGNGILSLYVNSTSSPAQIAFDAGVKAPQFDEASYFNLGAGVDGYRPWNNNFKWLKFYTEMQDPSMFILNQTSVNGFTAKLGSSLNVSQSGKVQVTALTGSDGTEPIDNSRISWTPQNSNISIASGTVDRVNLLSDTQSTVELGVTGLTGGTNTTAARSVSQSASGVASLSLTSIAAGNIYARTSVINENNGLYMPYVKAGKEYTAVASFRAAASARSCRVIISWTTASGTWISDSNGGTVTNTTSGWTQAYITATAPATAARAYLQFWVLSTGAASEVHYIDQMGMWEGTSTTWTPPLRPAVSGHEAQYLEQFATEPVQYLVDATLTTDDSYYNPTKLDDLKLEDFVDTTQYGENTFDEFACSEVGATFSANKSLPSQLLQSGAYIYDGKRAYIAPINDTGNTSVPTGGSGATTAGPSSLIRTLEFWVYPEEEGYIIFYDGDPEYSLRYTTAGGFSITGWSTLYVDGVARAAGLTVSNANWYNHWHHIVLTNSSAQIDISDSSSMPTHTNLLTYNQATVEIDTTGLNQTVRCTVLRSTAQAASGTASLELTATSTTSPMYAGTGPTYKIPVKGSTQYTLHVSSKADTNARVCFIGVWWFDKTGVIITTPTGPQSTSNSTSTWTNFTWTTTSPAGAAFCQVLLNISSVGSIGEKHYIDQLGIWEGTSTTWTAPTAKIFFGKYWSGYKPAIRLQNVSYYPQTFTAQQALENYKAYLGDVTTGSFSDAPGSRTLTDERPKYYSNIWNSQTILV